MDLLLTVLPFALGSAVSPVVLTLALLILTRPDHPVRMAIWFTIGLIVPLTVLTVLLLTVWQGAKTGASHHHRITSHIDLAAAGLLILFALRTILRNRQIAASESQEKSRGANAGPLACFGLGIIIMVVNFSTIVLYIAAVRDIAASHESYVVRACVFGFLVFMALFPALGPLIFTAVAPNAAHRVLGPLRSFVDKHAHAIGVAVSLILAVYLGAKGLAGL